MAALTPGYSAWKAYVNAGFSANQFWWDPSAESPYEHTVPTMDEVLSGWAGVWDALSESAMRWLKMQREQWSCSD